MKTRSRLLGIVTLAAVSLAAMALAVTRCHRNRTAPSLAGFDLIPAGEFTMGDSLDGDKDAPADQVNVSAFYMGQKEVTKAEWDAVKTWAVDHGYTDLATGAGKAADHPVQTVSWWDVVKWCNARSEKEGLKPCYTVSGSVMKTGTAAPTVNWAVTGYRLPTEAEWEKAARGGLSRKRFPWGDTISHSQANFRNDAAEAYQTGTTGYHPTYATGGVPYTSPVGSFSANGYGLQDMAGNVFECAGTGLALTLPAHRPIRGVRLRARAGWSGVAVGAAARTPRAARPAAAATRPARAAAWASAPSAVQSPSSSRGRNDE
jgi:formylglycine-generating enzyme required for sulfatase activity